MDIGTITAGVELRDEVTGQLVKFADATDEATTALSKFQGQAEAGAGGGLGSVASAFSAISSVALDVASRIGGMASEFVGFASHLTDLSARTNISTDALQRLSAQGLTVGVSLESMTGAMRYFNKALESDKAERVFAALGMSAQQLKDMAPDEALNKVGRALAGIEDPAQRATLGMQLLGRNWMQIAPAFSSEAIEAADRIKDLGFAIDKDLIAAGDNLGDQLDILSLGWDTFQRDIGGAIASTPALTEVVKFLQEKLAELCKWVVTNQDAVRGWIKDGILVAVDAINVAVSVIWGLGMGLLELAKTYYRVQEAFLIVKNMVAPSEQTSNAIDQMAIAIQGVESVQAKWTAGAVAVTNGLEEVRARVTATTTAVTGLATAQTKQAEATKTVVSAGMSDKDVKALERFETGELLKQELKVNEMRTAALPIMQTQLGQMQAHHATMIASATARLGDAAASDQGKAALERYIAALRGEEVQLIKNQALKWSGKNQGEVAVIQLRQLTMEMQLAGGASQMTGTRLFEAKQKLEELIAKATEAKVPYEEFANANLMLQNVNEQLAVNGLPAVESGMSRVMTAAQAATGQMQTFTGATQQATTAAQGFGKSTAADSLVGGTGQVAGNFNWAAYYKRIAPEMGRLNLGSGVGTMGFGIPSFAGGSGGVQDFGGGTLAVLHGRESVVPEGQTAGGSNLAAEIRALRDDIRNVLPAAIGKAYRDATFRAAAVR